MVEFEYQPYVKVIVHEITKIPLDLYILTRSLAAGDGATAPPLSWIGGIVFEHSLLPATDDLVNEVLKGIIHWASLTYADMKDFKDVLDGPRAVKVPVIKQEAGTFSELAIWLKEVYEPSLK